MKTAISLPDRVFREAERLARRFKKSRSQLYSDAIAEYLARHSSDEITDLMNAVCSRVGAPDRKFVTKAASNLFASETW